MRELYFDNRIFNINGAGTEMLEAVLDIAFIQAGHKHAIGWKESIEHGILLCWHDCDKDVNKFPIPLTAKEIVPMLAAYLNDDDTWARIKTEDWDEDADHDGSNSRGWRVFCEDWGHVVGNHYVFIAIKPAYIWHGK